MKKLCGLLLICAHCKGIRNDGGYWNSVEKYLGAHTEAGFTHGICPTCFQRHHPTYAEQRARNI